MMAVIVGLILAGRVPFLGFETADAHFYVLPWYADLATHGYRALGREAPVDPSFRGGLYSPPFYYLLYLATLFDGLLPPLYLVKGIATCWDMALAGLVFLIVRRVTGATFRAQVGFLLTLAAPTVVANSAVWGQSDAVYSTFLLAAVYASLTRRDVLACLAMGGALAFKAQTIFLAPYLLLLLVAGRLSWWRTAAIPLAYVALMLPAWILGRPLVDMLLAYVRQGGLYQKLSMNAPNLYYLMPDGFYSAGVVAGSLLTVVLSVGYAVLPRKRRAAWSDSFLLLAATVSLAAVPFVLPKMHDRYFFPADVLSIALALVVPRLWFVPILFQLSSGLSYVPAISDAFHNFDYEYVALMPVAVLINACLVPFLIAVYWREATEGGAVHAGQEPGAARS